MPKSGSRSSPATPAQNGKNQYTKLRIFVASPSDVAKERDRLKQVIDEINRIEADRLGLTLELLDWRTHVSPRMGRPQKVVSDQLPLEEWDVFVGILWTHFGTPPGETHPVTGEPFLSGTEEEFTQAYQAWQETGRPQILFYRCTRRIPVNIDAIQLQRVQEFFDEFQTAGAHPGLPQSYETEEDFERRVRADLMLLLRDYSEKQALETRQPAPDGLVEVREPEAPPLPFLPFINREDELAQIMSASAPPYHLVDAPAGYGKTALLKELQRRFAEQEWLCAYVSVQEHRSLPEIAQALATELGQTTPLTQDEDARRLGLNLGRMIMEHQGDRFSPTGDSKKGVVLLIDIDKKPWTSLLPTVDNLFTDFIPGIEYVLRGIEFFQTRHNAFRAVFAGRYLYGKTPPEKTAPEKTAPTTTLPLAILKLTPFSYEVVRYTVRAHLSDPRGVEQLAAYLMHYTAGHPRCITQVLKLYEERKYPPEEFFRYSANEIWEDIMWPEADAVRKDIDRELRRPLSELSVFRCFDYGVLKEVLQRDLIHGYTDEFELADALTTTYLMTWKRRLLRDDITRRLLALWLRQEIGPQAFARQCQLAQVVYTARLQDHSAQMPEQWAIEYLFQYLQQHTEAIVERQKRAQIRQTFFETIVPECLGLLLEKRNARAEENALVEALTADWDFRFTLNYFLRDKEYSDLPYQTLIESIRSFSHSATSQVGPH